ncbi:TPA: hypothetical protein F8V23_13965 [Legionella pneumophila]|nr:hypothetical protein [Legionella pneumophila]
MFSEYWSPKIVGEANDLQIKQVKFKGELKWHKHDNQDELFQVVNGDLLIRLRDKGINLIVDEILSSYFPIFF